MNTTPLEQKKTTRVLGAVHIWALGVGIVLVGEFMGWNNTIVRGGSLGAIGGMWTVSIMYMMIVMMTTEMASVMPEAGGQYTMAKYLLGPLAGFNVGLMLVFEYAMLEAADALVVGQLLQCLLPDIQVFPFVLLSVLVLAYINYHGAKDALTLNFVITAIAFGCILLLLFSTNFWNPQTTLLRLDEMTNGLPYGFLGYVAALQFSCWFFLGIEGVAMSADECRSVGRALPLGSIIALATLLVGGTITWFVCSGLIDAETLGSSVYPLYDAAVATGKTVVIVALFIGTLLSCLASANGCISSAARAWSALSKDTLLPSYFGRNHSKYNSPYRSIIFLMPISIAFAFTGLLDHIVTFSILSALLVYALTIVMMLRFRKMYPLGTIKRGYTAPLHPLPALVCLVLLVAVFFGVHLYYAIDMMAVAIFYFLASVWFLKRRYRFVDRREFLRAGLMLWGKPRNMDNGREKQS